MNAKQRLRAYASQRGVTVVGPVRLTARQNRRLNKKARREFKHYRQRWTTTTETIRRDLYAVGEYPRWAGPEVNEP